MSTALKPAVPVPESGFEHIYRYWDKKVGMYGAKIKPGEYFVSESGEPIATVLGSCVSVCARDTLFKIGGMNHFLLPDSSDSTAISSDATRYGAYAIEALLNAIYKKGGRKKYIEIKVFGGANIVGLDTDVGERNVHFVEDYMRQEKLQILSSDLGGDYPRKLIYHPDTGKVLMKRLETMKTIEMAREEKKLLKDVRACSVGGEVDLF